MSTPITGVYPCYENQFQINTAASGVEKKMVDIADCETFSVSFDNGVEEWHPFTEKGWVRRLLTSKGVTISVTAKRNVGDAGNDAVAALAWVNGERYSVDIPRRNCSFVCWSSRECKEHWSRGLYSCGTVGIRYYEQREARNHSRRVKRTGGYYGKENRRYYRKTEF